MNEERWKGKWHQLKGKIKEEWNELTDDELDAAEGRAEYISGKIQERYGIAKDEAERRIDKMSAEL